MADAGGSGSNGFVQGFADYVGGDILALRYLRQYQLVAVAPISKAFV